MMFITLLDNEFVHCLVVGSEHTHCSYLFHLFFTGTFDIYLLSYPTHGGVEPYYPALHSVSFFGGAYITLVLLLLSMVITFWPGLVPLYDCVGLATPCFCSGDHKRTGHVRFSNFWT